MRLRDIKVLEYISRSIRVQDPAQIERVVAGVLFSLYPPSLPLILISHLFSCSIFSANLCRIHVTLDDI